MARTTYLAAAICEALSDYAGGVEIEELEAQLSDYFDGHATREEILRELGALVVNGSVETIDYEGTTLYADTDE